eukprot:scaffold78403_cov30-Tisochrysis_lutea.AAC.5
MRNATAPIAPGGTAYATTSPARTPSTDKSPPPPGEMNFSSVPYVVTWIGTLASRRHGASGGMAPSIPRKLLTGNARDARVRRDGPPIQTRRAEPVSCAGVRAGCRCASAVHGRCTAVLLRRLAPRRIGKTCALSGIRAGLIHRRVQVARAITGPETREHAQVEAPNPVWSPRGHLVCEEGAQLLVEERVRAQRHGKFVPPAVVEHQSVGSAHVVPRDGLRERLEWIVQPDDVRTRRRNPAVHCQQNRRGRTGSRSMRKNHTAEWRRCVRVLLQQPRQHSPTLREAEGSVKGAEALDGGLEAVDRRLWHEHLRLGVAGGGRAVLCHPAEEGSS